MRGGSWNDNPQNVRVSNRNRNEPTNRNDNIGFRCAGYAERGLAVRGRGREPDSSTEIPGAPTPFPGRRSRRRCQWRQIASGPGFSGSSFANVNPGWAWARPQDLKTRTPHGALPQFRWVCFAGFAGAVWGRNSTCGGFVTRPISEDKHSREADLKSAAG